MDTKGCGQLTSNVTYFASIWFSEMKMAEDTMADGLYYCGPAKTSHNGFCMDTLENLMKEWPGVYHLVLKSTTIVPVDRKLMAIG